MKPQEQEDPAKGGEDWRERFDEQVPWHDGIRDNYVYVKDVEPFIESELKRAKAEERQRIEAALDEEIAPHGLSLGDSVWLKRLLNKVFKHK